MNCQIELEDFLDGELDAAQRAAIESHLSGCQYCQSEMSAIEREREVFKSFYQQNSLEPSDEMWTAIHARIKEEEIPAASLSAKLKNFFAPALTPIILRQMTFATLLVLVSVGLTALYFSSKNKEQKTIVAATPAPEASKTQPTPVLAKGEKPARPIELVKVKTPAKSALKPVLKVADRKVNEDELLALQIAKAGREYQSAIKLLNRAIAKRQHEYDEPTRLQYQASLDLIDKSIVSSRQALKQHPNDSSAAQFLLAAYSKKVELMQEIAMR